MMTFSDVGRGIAIQQEFFGVPIDRVNKTLALMVIYKKPSEWPQWLRGRHQMEMLPRWSGWSSQTDDVTEFPIPVIPPRAIAERIIWIVDYLGGEWGMNSRSFYFASPHDAFAYRMRWTA